MTTREQSVMAKKKELPMSWEEAVNRLPRKLDKRVVTLTLSYMFEPHGRASETWEDVCELTLETVQAYWKSNQGWARVTRELPMTFKGRTEEDVKRQAIEFIADAPWLKDEQHGGR